MLQSTSMVAMRPHRLLIENNIEVQVEDGRELPTENDDVTAGRYRGIDRRAGVLPQFHSVSAQLGSLRWLGELVVRM